MGLEKCKRSTDTAPDWTGHSYITRLTQAVMTLLAFNFITEVEAKMIFSKINKWADENDKQ